MAAYQVELNSLKHSEQRDIPLQLPNKQIHM